jgi:hypothetical protein
VGPYKPMMQQKTLAIKLRPPAGKTLSFEGRLCNNLMHRHNRWVTLNYYSQPFSFVPSSPHPPPVYFFSCLQSCNSMHEGHVVLHLYDV